jgi:hypothetical protein
VRRRVLVEGLRPALVGGILGMLLPYPATHLLIEMLFGVSERDPRVLGGSMTVLDADRQVGLLRSSPVIHRAWLR